MMVVDDKRLISSYVSVPSPVILTRYYDHANPRRLKIKIMKSLCISEIVPTNQNQSRSRFMDWESYHVC